MELLLNHIQVSEIVLLELSNKKESKLFGKEMELTFLDISPLKLLTSLSKTISKDFSTRIKTEMDILPGSVAIWLLEVLLDLFLLCSFILLIMQEQDSAMI